MCMSLKGLDMLQNLVELNLADNSIEKIGMFLFLHFYFLLRVGKQLKQFQISSKGTASILIPTFRILICLGTI